MSESETSESSSPRFSKALLGRVAAVGLFVVLGTFAVVQSMKGFGQEASAIAESDNGSPVDESGSPDTDPNVAPTSPPNANADPTRLGNADITPTKLSTEDPQAKKSFDPKSGFQSIGGGIASKPNLQRNSFSVTPLKTPNETAAEKPRADRYAQGDSGIPIITSRNGFAARATQPPAGTLRAQAAGATQKLGGDLEGVFENTAQKTTAAAQAIKDKAAQAEALLKKLGNKTRDKLAGPFAQKPDTGTNSTQRTFAPDPSAFSNTQKMTTPNSKFANTDFGGLRNSATSRPNEPANPSGFTPPRVDTGLAAQTANPAEKRTFPNDLRAKTPPNNANAAISTPLNQPFARPLATAKTAADLNSIRRQTTAIQAKTSAGAGTGNPSGPGANQPGTPFGTQQNNMQQDSARQTARPAARSTFAETPNKSILTQRATTVPALGNSPNNQFGSFGGSGQNALSGRQTTPPANSNLQAMDKPGARNLDGVQAPALTVEKRSPREIQVKQTAEFELIVKNVGRVAAEDVQVFDHVPAGTEFKGAVPEPTRLSQNRDIQWSIGQLLPGQEKRIKLKLQPMVPGEIGSVAHVTFATRASMRTLVTKPELEIVHQTKPTHLIGDSVVLDVVVKNKGDGPAKNVMIQQDVPKQLDFPDGLPGGNRGIEYEIGTLLPGKSRRIRLNLKAANIGKIRNVMYASADGGLQAKHELPMEIVSPKLVARTEGPKIRFLNRNVTHTFSVANQGTASATNVELVAKLPNGLKFLEANNQGLYDRNTHAVHWNVSELARGVEAKVELKTTPIAVGSQPLKFETFGDLNMKAQAEHQLSVEHLVDVFFDIDDVADPIEIGADTTYQIRVVNQGTKAATNVKLNVDFPNGLAPTSVDGALRHNIRGQQILFEPINSMSPGDEIKIIIHAKGQAAGDHRVVVNMQTDGRSTQVSKQETTRVYSDR